MEDKYLTLGETLLLFGVGGAIALGALAICAWVVIAFLRWARRR